MFAAAAALPIVAAPIALAGVADGWIFGAAALAAAVCDRVRGPCPRPLRRADGGQPHARVDHDLRGRRWRSTRCSSLARRRCSTCQATSLGCRGRPLRSSRCSSHRCVTRCNERSIASRSEGGTSPTTCSPDLGQRLEATVDVDRLLADVIGELGGLGLDDVAICDEDGHVIAGGLSSPEPGADVATLPLAAYGRTGRDAPIPPALHAVARSRSPAARRSRRAPRRCAARPSPHGLISSGRRKARARSRGGTPPAPPRPARRARAGTRGPPPPARRDRRRARRAGLAAAADVDALRTELRATDRSRCGESSRDCGRRRSTSSASPAHSRR